jgi:tRNA (guanine-N7-)-methyltransferase
MAQLQPDWNFLGLEIREPLVIQANQWAAELGLTNLYFLFGNATRSLQPVLQSLGTEIHRVTIQFPDPWFKKRHQKRRMVQPDMVNDIATYLISSGTVLLQSDVEPVSREMCDRFQSHPNFFRTHAEWLKENPLPVPTERELSTLERGGAVYRAVFVKG